MNKILVIGTGSIGKRHISNFSKFFDKIDISEIRKDRQEETKNKFKINEVYDDYKIPLNKNKYDAVIITTPPHLHLPIAELACNKGNNILIEKPLGMNSTGWEEIAKICEKKELINYVAYCHRHINYTKKLKDHLEAGIIGKIINANVRWGSYFPDWHPWEDYRDYYMAKKEQGGGALLDESHGLDLIRYFFGEASEVFAVVDKISDLEITTDDNAFVTLKMKNKMFVHLSFDLISRFTFCKIEINGSKGSLIWDRVDHNLKIYNAEKKTWETEQFTKEDFLEMYINQAKHFVECLQNKTQPMISIRDALKTQKIIDNSFLSSETGKSIKI